MEWMIGLRSVAHVEVAVGLGGPPKVASDYCSGQRAIEYKRDGWAIFGRATQPHGVTDRSHGVTESFHGAWPSSRAKSVKACYQHV